MLIQQMYLLPYIYMLIIIPSFNIIVLPNIRDGILIHTGNWSTATAAWDSSMSMPNSAGCIHAHPEDVERIYRALVSQGVVIRDNPFSGKNYPYQPQGVGVIELID